MIEKTEQHQAEASASDKLPCLDASSAINPFLSIKENQYGKGVYATTAFPEGTLLKLYKPEHIIFNKKIADVPEELRKYVAYVDDEHCNAPADFTNMDMAWFINHSGTPNVSPVDGEMYKVIKDIRAGDELFFDYNHLNEPEGQKEDFYK